MNNDQAELGDLTGRWNMIAVLPYNEPTASTTNFDATNLNIDLPTNTCSPTDVTKLTEIRDSLLTCIRSVFYNATTDSYLPYPEQLKTVQGLLSLQTSNELFGFFSVPIKYRKYGVRFEFSGVLYKGLGFTADIGVSNISQSAKFVDMTTSTTCNKQELCLTACPSNLTPLIACLNPFSTTTVSTTQWGNVIKCVNTKLMDKLNDIAKATQLDLCNYNKTSIEDFHGEIFYRQAFCINNKRSREWPRFLLIPFFQLGGTVAMAKEGSDNVAFSLPSGNNGFNCMTFLGGLSLDFANTIEVGGEGGFNHYFKRKITCMRVPTTEFQNGIIPYQTEVCIDPGNVWHFSLYMNSRYFVEHTSAWFQYVYINHDKDNFTVLGPNVSLATENEPPNEQVAVFLPGELKCKSAWTAQLFNFGLNYDISPNFSLGALAQIPMSRTNAYRSSTLFVSLNMFF
ncbi:hypothetical protein A3F66_00135 [candidate division TM6 bacterium RIFCSPHIGHO2_12_FULL_32_22]|nr:MAG: hypothetical protein A3F66_00135 [candidate division TM6 bacterium RIFCSPHIGHO2_12_FULL_32_22]